MFVFWSYQKKFVGTKKQVWIHQGKRTIGVWAIEVPLYKLEAAIRYIQVNCSCNIKIYIAHLCRDRTQAQPAHASNKELCLVYYAPPPKVAGYYVIPSEILCVRPSVCPSISAPTIRLPATPPTVLGQSFSNFTGAFRMVWKYAYCFFRILKLFFITFVFIFNLDFFSSPNTTEMYGEYVPCMRNSSYSFETLHTLLRWSEDKHIVFFRILKLFFITFYCMFNLDFFVCFFFFFFFEFWNNCLLLLFMFNLDCFQPLYYRSA